LLTLPKPCGRNEIILVAGYWLLVAKPQYRNLIIKLVLTIWLLVTGCWLLNINIATS